MPLAILALTICCTSCFFIFISIGNSVFSIIYMERFNYKEKAIAVIVYCKNHCQVRFEMVTDFQNQIT